MKSAAAVALLLLARALGAGAEGPPSGHWRNMDVKGIESLQDGTCVRLWLEERAYDLIPQSPTRLTGTYANFIRVTPVGASSLRPECKYPPPAESPLSMQVRSWSLVGTQNGDGTWRIRAAQALGSGNMHAYKTDDFETVLTRSGSSLVDAAGDMKSSNGSLIFKAPTPPPAAARTLLEETLRRLHGGECLAVQSRFTSPPAVAQQMCALRQRAAAFAGRYLSLTVDSTDEFDRVPVGFPWLSSSNFRRQHGVFFSFTARYEKQEIPCGAVLLEEEDGWDVERLWC